jgi:hypothetical protein
VFVDIFRKPPNGAKSPYYPPSKIPPSWFLNVFLYRNYCSNYVVSFCNIQSVRAQRVFCCFNSSTFSSLKIDSGCCKVNVLVVRVNQQEKKEAFR